MKEMEKSALVIQSFYRGYRIRNLLNLATKLHCDFESKLGLEFEVTREPCGLLKYSQHNGVFDKIEEYI